MGKTKIEWCTDVWNPLRGCSRVSEGCRNCYAERVAARFSGPGLPYEGLTTPAGNWNGKVKLVEDHLTDPLRWKKPRKIFVNSMSDLFHESVPFDWIDRIFAVMALCPQHTFQVLTKRPERMRHYFGGMSVLTREGLVTAAMDQSFDLPRGRSFPRSPASWPLPNVWLGVSVEDQPSADERIPHLLRTPAAVRFLSVEPMLGAVDLTKVPRPDDAYFRWRGETGVIGPKSEPDDYIYWQKKLIDWVICGGESGPHARPMHPAWARSLRDQCQAAGVPFFFKQWGEFALARPCIDGELAEDGWVRLDGTFITSVRQGGLKPEDVPVVRVGKKAAGRMLDGRTWDEFPQAVTA